MIAIPRSTALTPLGALYLKTVAVLLMVFDHFDTAIMGGALGVHATIGRIVFPIFAVVLAFNLARSDNADHLLSSVAPRMAAFGLLAMPAYVYLYDVYPANVMFTLAASVLVVSLVLERRWLLAGLLFAVAGAWVDYGWFGIGGVVGAWYLVQTGRGFLAPALVAVLVYPINGTLWALVAVPLVAAAGCLQGSAPRLKWAFYAAYPLHLLAIACVKVFAV